MCAAGTGEWKNYSYVCYLFSETTSTSICAAVFEHCEAGLSNPLKDSWFISSTLKGIDRVKGMAVNRKNPITPDILLRIKKVLKMTDRDDVFWAACLVMFFGLFRKANLFAKQKFDVDKHFTRAHLLSATVRVYSLVAPCRLPDLTSLALLGSVSGQRGLSMGPLPGYKTVSKWRLQLQDSIPFLLLSQRLCTTLHTSASLGCYLLFTHMPDCPLAPLGQVWQQ